MLVYVALLAGCALLFIGGDSLLKGVTAFGYRLGWSKAIVGLFLVSLGTSAPELFVSVGASLQGHGAIAAGNVVGSNIINIAIVLGLAASVTVMVVERVLQRQLLAMTAITIVAAAMLYGGVFSRLEGLVLLSMTVAGFIYAYWQMREQQVGDNFPGQPGQVKEPLKPAIAYSVGGIIALLVGAEAMIWGGIILAERFGVPEAIVALTVTAVGTSLPEIAATAVAVIKREASLAVGNVIGSNLLNLGLVLGVSGVVMPLDTSGIDTVSLAVFLGLTLFITALGIRPGRYPRWSGTLLMLSYIVYGVVLLK